MLDLTNSSSSQSIPIQHCYLDGSRRDVDDEVAVEEPLEILVAFGPEGARCEATVSLTMRTPGHDADLAAGFLFTEGVIHAADDIAATGPVGIDWVPGETANAVRVELKTGCALDLKRLERHFYTSSSCGVCGKTSIDAVRSVLPSHPVYNRPAIEPTVICGLPPKLRAVQETFDKTGGLHASALFDLSGNLLIVREDVGRHNALDKLIGAELMAGRVPLTDRILLVSGRASFELVQKAAMAGVGAMAAVGAPSSLAVELAKEAGIALIGFVKLDRFNVYA